MAKWKSSTVVFVIWCVLALASLLPITNLLDGAFPIFTVLWILPPLIAVLRSKDATQVGFTKVSWPELVRVTVINLGGLFLVALLFEPWSHTYQRLIEVALSSQPTDTTFAWLIRYPKPTALTGMFFYSGLITLFGEELFFRGWLLQLLSKRWGIAWAIVIQATLFVIPNLLVALVIPPLQGILYVTVYTWLSIGLIGGWAAARTKSIWPSLISATICNLVFVVLIV